MWFDEHGEAMTIDLWHDPHRRVLQKYRVSPEEHGRDMLLVVNGAANDVQVTVPDVGRPFELVWDSVWERPTGHEPITVHGGTVTTVPGLSVRLYLGA